jgi:hypothetical protein
MNDNTERKACCAAVAGWWTVIYVLAFVLLQWLLYLLFMSTRPAWLLSLWGPGTTWEYVQRIWFLGIAAAKVSCFALAIVSLWLTLWARQLRKKPSS